MDCLTREPDGWHVDYNERGHRNNERVFLTEPAANDKLFRIVTGDGALQRLLQGDS